MKLKLSKGFSLIEVMIAFVILIVGLLGATTLIIRSSQVNVTAYETDQIAMLANTMVEKIRANPDGISTYKTLDRPSSGVSNCQPDHDGSSCTAVDRANADKFNFQAQIDKSDINGVTWKLEDITGSTNLLTGTAGKPYKLTITWGAMYTGSGTNTTPENSYIINFIL